MIIVYSSPSCTNCKSAKEILNSDNISFQEIDITQDNKSRMKLVQGGFAKLPVFEKDGELYDNIDDILSK